MKIELKEEKITWRTLRERYELLSMISGLKGLNMLVCYNHNLHLLKKLYTASSLESQYPDNENKFKKFEQERIEQLTKLATINGVVKKKVIEINGKNQEVFDIDYNSKEFKDTILLLTRKYDTVIKRHETDTKEWNDELDKVVPDEYLPKFWHAPFDEAPTDDQYAFVAVEWFLKDIPDLT
jgi:hypothetical protein